MILCLWFHPALPREHDKWSYQNDRRHLVADNLIECGYVVRYWRFWEVLCLGGAEAILPRMKIMNYYQIVCDEKADDQMAAIILLRQFVVDPTTLLPNFLSTQCTTTVLYQSWKHETRKPCVSSFVFRVYRYNITNTRTPRENTKQTRKQSKHEINTKNGKIYIFS